MRILVLVTDAFGGHGGIAKFNRDLLKAVCSYKPVQEVHCLPRISGDSSGKLPEKLRFAVAAARSKFAYVLELLKRSRIKPSLIICGHIHLLPLAFLCRLLTAAPILLIIHGIEAWQPTGRAVTDFLAKRVRHFVAVSHYSRRRFCAWTRLPEEIGSILPNCVDLSLYGPGPKNPELLTRYKLDGQKVILTLGRLAAAERYKGFDEVLDVMPDLLQKIPNLTYIIAGDGADGPRLVAKAKSLGLSVLDCAQRRRDASACDPTLQSPSTTSQSPPAHDAPTSTLPPHVIFTGRVPEIEKVDHYRLADLYVMPSRGEGFGIVYLEALASGIPVIGSKVDGSVEALKEGELGVLVDPNDRSELTEAMAEALRSPQPVRLDILNHFSVNSFDNRLHKILETVSGSVLSPDA